MVNLQDPTVAPLATHPPPPPPEPQLEAQSSQQSGLSTVTLGAELLQGVQDFLSGASAAAVTAGSAVTVAPVSQNSSFTVDSVLNNPSHDVAHVADKLSLAAEQPPGKAVQPVSVSPPAPPSSEGGPFAELSNVVVASAASPSAALSPPPSGGTTTVLQPLAISVGGAVTSPTEAAAVDAVNLALVQEIRRPDSPTATISTSKVRRTLRPSFPRSLVSCFFPAAELDLFKCKLRWENQYWTTTNRPRPSLIARRVVRLSVRRPFKGSLASPRLHLPRME